MHQTACMHALGGYIQQLCWLISPSEKRRSKTKTKSHKSHAAIYQQQSAQSGDQSEYFLCHVIDTELWRWLRAWKREGRNQRLALCNCTAEQRFMHHSEGTRNRPATVPRDKGHESRQPQRSPAPVCSGSGCIPGAFVAVRASDWIRWLEKLQSLLLVTHGSQRWPLLLVWSRSECSRMSWALWSDFCFFACNRSQTLTSALIHSTEKRKCCAIRRA